jgi:hypothetical protein
LKGDRIELKKLKLISILLAVVLMSGCGMRTVHELYQLPKRSEEYNNLQSAIDSVMNGLEYCAPLSGEHPQTVQMADLDGDGVPEYLLFAKGSTEKPLHILIFREVNDEYVLSETIQSAGAAFDVVQYARVDDRPGYELIVGHQVSDQVTRSVTVYSFESGKAAVLMNANYTKFVTCDLNADGRTGLLVLRPGEATEQNGVAEVYYYANGVMERSNEVSMSQPVDRIKRIINGYIHGGSAAVYVASAVGESAVVTDVFTLVENFLSNISFSNETGTGVQTLRNYYVYADDIDEDGVVELPDLNTMRIPFGASSSAVQYVIRWYAMTAEGAEVDKRYTYHNFQGGWYLTLDSAWAKRLAVVQQGNMYEFYIWDDAFYSAEKIMTVFALTGEGRDEEAMRQNRFVLHNGDSVTYAANLEVASAAYLIAQETLQKSFHVIHHDWKNGET